MLMFVGIVSFLACIAFLVTTIYPKMIKRNSRSLTQIQTLLITGVAFVVFVGCATADGGKKDSPTQAASTAQTASTPSTKNEPAKEATANTTAEVKKTDASPTTAPVPTATIDPAQAKATADVKSLHTDSIEHYQEMVQEKLKFVDGAKKGAAQIADQGDRVNAYNHAQKAIDSFNTFQSDFFKHKYIDDDLDKETLNHLRSADDKYAVAMQSDIAAMKKFQAYLDNSKPSDIEEMKTNLAVAQSEIADAQAEIQKALDANK